MKKRVVLLFGGRSSEHSISCATAGGIFEAIDRDRFEVIPVGVTRTGAFVLAADIVAELSLDLNNLPEVKDNGTRVHWPSCAGYPEFWVTDEFGYRSLGVVDVVFPVLHGRYGEDGSVQGLLEFLGIPFVGNGVFASAAGMDKHATKVLLESAGITVAPWVRLSQVIWADRAGVMAKILQLQLPVFVKPARAGSSVGVSKVVDWVDLEVAVELAFAEDSIILVEQGISGREIECAVLGTGVDTEPRTSVAGEVIIAGSGFYDFAAKYLGSDGVELACPADMSPIELAELQRISKVTFGALGCEGLARVDVFLSDSGFVVNEVNTMPGFTPISMYPWCWQNSGLSYRDLVSELIELGIRRGPR